MGQMDHLARMRELVEAGPMLMTPIDFDYITDRLQTVEGARDFTQVASGHDWLACSQVFTAGLLWALMGAVVVAQMR